MMETDDYRIIINGAEVTDARQRELLRQVIGMPPWDLKGETWLHPTADPAEAILVKRAVWDERERVLTLELSRPTLL